MSGTDQPLPITTSEAQGQLDELSKEMKEMAALIATLVKAITPQNNVAAQTGVIVICDACFPHTYH